MREPSVPVFDGHSVTAVIYVEKAIAYSHFFGPIMYRTYVYIRFTIKVA